MSSTAGIFYRTAEAINTAMAGVYKHMCLAILTSMLVSWFISGNQELLGMLFNTPVKWVVIFAPLVGFFAVMMVLESKPSRLISLLCLHGFAVVMGLSMSGLFALYTSLSIISAFMGATVLFAVMSFYGYFTKRELNSWGKWLAAGLIAILIAAIINIFIGSTALQMAVSSIAIIIFTALTAYDTQNIRNELAIDDSPAVEVSGALRLYMNFINLLINLLQLFGSRDK